MKCDNCRWFNKNGFASGTGNCVLHRFVCGSGHEACEHYEEYEPRPHGTWIDVNGDGSLWKCSNCNEKSCCRGNFCSDCGSNNRKMGDKE